MRSVMSAVAVLAGMAIVARAADRSPPSAPEQGVVGNLSDAERQAFFNQVVKAGGRVFCENVSRYRFLRGHDLSIDLWPLQDLTRLASLYCLLPHRIGLVDVAAHLSPVVDDLKWLELRLFGSAPGYTVVIRESPSLAKDVEVLSRIPNLVDVVIQTKQMDDRLLKDVQKIKALGDLQVGYRKDNYYVLFSFSGNTTAYVDIDKAKESIPSLKTVSRLVAICILAPLEKDQDQAERVGKVVQLAIPNVLVFLSGLGRSNLAASLLGNKMGSGLICKNRKHGRLPISPK